MERMFRVLGFWTGIFSVMFYVGDMQPVTTIFRTNRFLRTFKLFKINRAYVYIRIWGIFNCFLHRIYILHDILTCAWGWTLKDGILPSF
ncbi:DUF2626 family protein [Bacillus thuringiensis]|uniref:DUF2626 family protein n=1 Tax=Bacillus thuringiensis TaxID=1428 RepID=UPI003D1D6A17